MDLQIEIWKDIVGYEGLYQISNFGMVKSLVRDKIMKLKVDDGYNRISLRKNSGYKIFPVHRLIAVAFIPNPKNKTYINHLNGIKNDNRIENLEWCTASENRRHALDVLKVRVGKPGIGRFGKYHHNSKKILQFDINNNLIREWECTMEIERKLGIKRKNISNCINGMSRVSAGFMWKTKKQLQCQS